MKTFLNVSNLQYTCTCTCIWIYMYMYMYMNIHVHVHVHVHEYTCTCVHVFSTQYVSIIYENVHVTVLIRSQVIHIPILTYRYTVYTTSKCMTSFLILSTFPFLHIDIYTIIILTSKCMTSFLILSTFPFFRYILLASICMASFQSSLDAGYIIRHTISC